MTSPPSVDPENTHDLRPTTATAAPPRQPPLLHPARRRPPSPPSPATPTTTPGTSPRSPTRPRQHHQLRLRRARATRPPRTDPQLSASTSPGAWTYTYDARRRTTLGRPTRPAPRPRPPTTTSARGHHHRRRCAEPAAAVYTTTNQLRRRGQPAQADRPAGVVTSYTYDAAASSPATPTRSATPPATPTLRRGRTAQQDHRPTGDGVGYGYDAAGEPVTAYNDSDRGRRPSRARPQLRPTTSPGNLTCRRPTARDHTTSYTYDALDELTQQIEPVAARLDHHLLRLRRRRQPHRAHRRARKPTWTTYNPWTCPSRSSSPPPPPHPNAADRTFTTSYDAAGQPVDGHPTRRASSSQHLRRTRRPDRTRPAPAPNRHHRQAVRLRPGRPPPRRRDPAPATDTSSPTTTAACS